MNKNEPMKTENPGEEIKEARTSSPLRKEASNEFTPIVYEATIITPHPYGVFALCKIVEHLQIN